MRADAGRCLDAAGPGRPPGARRREDGRVDAPADGPRPDPGGGPGAPGAAGRPGATTATAAGERTSGLGALPRLLRGRGLRRLLLVRLLSQSGDGAFQLGLAGLLLFAPERAPSAGAVVALLALVLLPYTLVGPLVGTVLDRWPRRSVLVLAGALRAAAVAGTALLVGVGGAAPGTAGEVLLVPAVLVCLSVNRLVLAALGSGLPAVVEPRDLVLASSVVPTVGTLALGAGAAAGAAVRLAGGGDAAVLGLAAAAVVGSVLAALRLPAGALGGGHLAPTGGAPGPGAALGAAGRDLLDGLRHLRARPVAARAMAGLAASRAAAGVLLVLVVVVTRTRLTDPGTPAGADEALALTGLALGAASGGVVLAVVTTPGGAARTGPARWGAGCLVVAGLAAAALAAALAVPALALGALVAGGLVLGGAGQALKICVDALVLGGAGPDHRGRLVAVHDAVFNAATVLGALAAALLLPPGPSDAAVTSLLLPLAVLLLSTAVLLARVDGRPVAPAAGAPTA